MWMGLIQSVEGLNRTKTDLPKQEGILPIALGLELQHLPSPQQITPPFRFWMFQPSTILSLSLTSLRSVSLETPD